MRIPNFTISDSLVSRLQKLTATQADLQAQVSSGQRITVASDDPAAMARVLDFQTEKQNLQQWARNGDRALGVSQASFSAVKQLKSVSDRAGEIAVLGVGATGADAYNAYSTEVNALLEQALQVANTKNGGQNLFGGTQTSTPPFTATRDVAGQITGVTYTAERCRDFFAFSVLACFRGFAPVAVFRPWGATFFRLAAFFDAVFSGATVAPGCATAAAVWLVSAFVMIVWFPFSLPLGAPDSSLRCA